MAFFICLGVQPARLAFPGPYSSSSCRELHLYKKGEAKQAWRRPREAPASSPSSLRTQKTHQGAELLSQFRVLQEAAMHTEQQNWHNNYPSTHRLWMGSLLVGRLECPAVPPSMSGSSLLAKEQLPRLP